MAAPVVPTMLAIRVPKASMAGVDAAACRLQIAGNKNAARHHIEREQQDDEAEIFREQRMDEGRGRGGSGRAAQAIGSVASTAQASASLP